MKVKDNVIYADEGMILRRKSDLQFCGTIYWCGYVFYLNGKKLDEPYIEKPEDFEEVPDALPGIIDKQEKERLYPETVDGLIRRKYSQSDELAIQRQRDTKPEKFQEYYDYCEECKKEAKKILGLEEPEPKPTPPNDEQPIEETIEESPENQEKTE